MKNIFKLNVVAAIALLSGCQNTEDPTAAKSLADISNADLADRNRGLDSLGFLVGLVRTF